MLRSQVRENQDPGPNFEAWSARAYAIMQCHRAGIPSIHCLAYAITKILGFAANTAIHSNEAPSYAIKGGHIRTNSHMSRYSSTSVSLIRHMKPFQFGFRVAIAHQLSFSYPEFKTRPPASRMSCSSSPSR